MFSILILLIVSLATHVYGNVVSNKAAVDRLISRIKSSVTVDLKNPPFYNTNIERKPDCLAITPFSSRGTTEFSHRHFLKSIKELNVLHTVNVERYQDNLTKNPSVLRITTSTAKTQSTTSGWTVGGKLSLGGGDTTKGSLELSAAYSKSGTNSNTHTTSVEHTITCNPGYECSIETWTFYAEIKGTCELRMRFGSNGKEDMCEAMKKGDSRVLCDQFKPLRQQYCAKPRMHSCDVTIPLADATGKPVTRIVGRSEKL
ncbi:hypothetical protein PRK78_006791 [Emydomyces testavorans]|uniref:Lipocalin n=1 Tax=Emydomyces testavorans TaxID=2070801 RepID=A0AAF0IM19_9EURO|nr:hypothetical protein PRK78_006791 [Emydomyces testavorans]